MNVFLFAGIVLASAFVVMFMAELVIDIWFTKSEKREFHKTQKTAQRNQDTK